MNKCIKFFSACMLFALGACTDYQGDYASANAAEVAAWKAAGASSNGGPASAAVDSRNGREYETVKIGSQVWLAENVDILLDGGRCYNDLEENCNVYGILYTQDVAMVSCPAGYHLPSSEEWNNMTAPYMEDASALMFERPKYWSYKHSNTTGFTALPGGMFQATAFKGIEESAVFWTSDPGVYLKIDETDGGASSVTFYSTKKVVAASVRCVK